MGRSRSRSPQRRGLPERERDVIRDATRDIPRDPVRDRDVDRERERRLPESTVLLLRDPRNRSPRRRRSRSPRRPRSPRRRSRSRERKEKGENMPLGSSQGSYLERPPVTEKDLEGKTEDEKEMIKMMGFANFDTSKGKHMPGNNTYGVHVIHKRKYREVEYSTVYLGVGGRVVNFSASPHVACCNSKSGRVPVVSLNNWREKKVASDHTNQYMNRKGGFNRPLDFVA
uniref:U4/U6.U5 small nuclear ribonucleoprotein 27 kDa protein n=1 Tax=Ixodes ricinus TaxID=34613 RepID=A0A090XAB3_IXORI